MGPFNDENKLQVKEQQKQKIEKSLKMYRINFKTTRYKVTALANIIHSVLN